jgi:parallel beta-helix repeat protein
MGVSLNRTASSLGIFALSVAGLMAFGVSEASASHVSCGDTIRAETTLDSDLDCGELSGTSSALTIGAHRVTLDLNGHTISTACEGDCAGTVVIDDSGGYDRVRILDGTIRPGGVGVGVALVDADKSVLRGVTVAGFPRPLDQPGVGMSLSNSHRNQLDNVAIGGGDPALLLSASHRNEISRSSFEGGIAIQQGVGVRLRDGSDDNRIVDSVVGGPDAGLAILGSVGNHVTRSDVSGRSGAIFASDADRSVISRNRFGETFLAFSISMVSSDENVIRRNQAQDELFVSGDRNRVERNDVSAPFRGIFVSQGDGNRVRKNNVSGGGGCDDGIGVASAATNTLVQGNLATGNCDDGIDVDAPGTVIRANTANDNGDLGIEAVAGAIDGGGNRASGNGDPRQCVNVTCH